MISLERRFIFVHIPKTAGTSLESRLVDDSCVFLSHQWDREVCKHAPLNHLTLAEIERCGILSKAELRDFFIFTVVRNPWDRCISELFCPWVGRRFGTGV